METLPELITLKEAQAAIIEKKEYIKFCIMLQVDHLISNSTEKDECQEKILEEMRLGITYKVSHIPIFKDIFKQAIKIFFMDTDLDPISSPFRLFNFLVLLELKLYWQIKEEEEFRRNIKAYSL